VWAVSGVACIETSHLHRIVLRRRRGASGGRCGAWWRRWRTTLPRPPNIDTKSI